MKIAIVCYNHFDATISLAKYLSQIDEHAEVTFICLLSQSFLNVEIIELAEKGIKNGFIDKSALRTVVDKEIFDYLGTKIRFEIFVFNSYRMADLKNFKLLFKLKAEIASRSYDVMHFVGTDRWIIFLNFLLRQIPKIHTIHEPYPFSKMSAYRLLRHKLKMKLLVYCNKQITVPSHISFSRFNEHFDKNKCNLQIIPFGPFEIYKQYIRPEQSISRKSILYYGNIDEYKGINVLMNAIEIVLKTSSGIHFIIAGSGQPDFNLPASSTHIEILNRYLSNRQIAEFNNRASMVVCPYLTASQSGVVMTSFAFNNPVIGTNVGALPEYIENGSTGIIIEPNDAQNLSEVILQMTNKPDLLQVMRNNIIRKYSLTDDCWLAIANTTYDLYKEQIVTVSK